MDMSDSPKRVSDRERSLSNSRNTSKRFQTGRDNTEHAKEDVSKTSRVSLLSALEGSKLEGSEVTKSNNHLSTKGFRLPHDRAQELIDSTENVSMKHGHFVNDYDGAYSQEFNPCISWLCLSFKYLCQLAFQNGTFEHVQIPVMSMGMAKSEWTVRPKKKFSEAIPVAALVRTTPPVRRSEAAKVEHR